VETKLRQLRPQLKVAALLVDAVLQGLNRRFEGYSDCQELVLASITLPQFRLRWLDEPKKASVRATLYQHRHTMILLDSEMFMSRHVSPNHRMMNLLSSCRK